MLAKIFWSLQLALSCALSQAQQLNTNFDLLGAVRGDNLAVAASLLSFAAGAKK